MVGAKKLMIYRTNIATLFIFLIFMISGCASTPRYVKTEDLQKINKLGIVTILKDKNLKVIDVRHIKQGARTNNIYYGGLLGVLTTEVVADVMVNLTVGNIGDIREALTDYPIKQAFDEIFFAEFLKNIKGKDIPEVIVLNSTACSRTDRSECLIDIKTNHSEIDAIIKIDFSYGIGAFEGQKPQPAIEANVQVFHLRDNRILMRNEITFTALYLEGHSVEEYADNNAELFKKDFKDVAESFGRDLSSGYIF